MIAGTGLVLVIGGDRDLVERVASYLEAHDYLVLKAYSVREGITLAKLERPDLLIVQSLCEADAALTVRAVRTRPGLSRLPFIVMGSEAGPPTPAGAPRGAGEAEGDLVLPEALAPARVLDRIRVLLEEREKAGAR